jgi:hypothetical protein
MADLLKAKSTGYLPPPELFTELEEDLEALESESKLRVAADIRYISVRAGPRTYCGRYTFTRTYTSRITESV